MASTRITNRLVDFVSTEVVRSVFAERKEALRNMEAAVAYGIWEGVYPEDTRKILTSPRFADAFPTVTQMSLLTPSYAHIIASFEGQEMPVFHKHVRRAIDHKQIADPTHLARLVQKAEEFRVAEQDYQRSTEDLLLAVRACLNSVTTITAAIKAYPDLEQFLAPYNPGNSPEAGKQLAIPNDRLAALFKQYKGA